MMTFSQKIFEMFNVNVSSVSTLPSLAFKIFRAKFLPKNINLPVLTGKVYEDISKAFYGGHVDMYIPTNPEGTEVYGYDANSLYPYAMNEFKYPGKILAYFRGDITQKPEYVKLYNNSLAVLKVKVTTPKGILHPILPHKVNGTTIYPEGSWTGWYYKDELENALKYGYKYRILEGYLFESTTIFTEFVNTLYKIKETSNPKSPEYTNVKLILNSVFGRFGMKPFQISHIVVNNHYVAGKIEDIGLDNVLSTLEYNNKTIISFNPKFPNVPMVNVAIASAITANARVYMSVFKNNPEYILYYTDTDSYFFNKPLPAHIVDGKKLGFF